MTASQPSCPVTVTKASLLEAAGRVRAEGNTPMGCRIFAVRSLSPYSGRKFVRLYRTDFAERQAYFHAEPAYFPNNLQYVFEFFGTVA